MVYAKFGGQTECIMGNWKIENGLPFVCRSSFVGHLGLLSVEKRERKGGFGLERNARGVQGGRLICRN